MGRELDLFLKAYPAVVMIEALITDCNGVARGKWIPRHKLQSILNTGIKLPKGVLALDVWGRDIPELALVQGDADGFCRAVPESLRPVLNASGNIDQAQVILTMFTEDNQPYPGDPRQVLSGIIDRFHALGLKPCMAAELEFSLLPDPGRDKPASAAIAPLQNLGGNLYALEELDRHQVMLDSLREYFELQVLPYEGIIKEGAPAQYEINMAHSSDVLSLADDIVLMQRGIRTVAGRYGLIASFMPKPFGDVPGNGMHVHCSMLDQRGINVFNDGTPGLSPALSQAVAGSLAVMPDFMLVFSPSFNGYRRFLPGNHAPTFPAWGLDNRTTAIRIPSGPATARRIEHRVAGADANPYLSIAAVLAGILHGFENELEPPPPVMGNAYDQEPKNSPLPTMMSTAIDRFSKSEAVATYMTEAFRTTYTLTKSQEFAEFQRRVTEFELESYLRG